MNKPLTEIERQMCTAYIEVHSRKINEYMRAARKGNPSDASARHEQALAEAQGVVAALGRLLAS